MLIEDIVTQYESRILYCQYRKLIRILLREAIERYQQRTGVRLTYKILAEKTGISAETLQSLAARPGYNTRLSTVERLCLALECSPGELLELCSGEPLEDEDN
jgi:DNA-binding Xre family transcriptional regulator